MHVSSSRNSHKQDKLKQTLKNSLNLGGRILICTLFVAVSLAAAADWTFICDTDNCDTYLLQEEDGWYMEIDCEDGDSGSWSGPGIYGGTITCGG